MARLLAFLIASTISLSAIQAASADEYVSGFTRKDGTFVQPHMRSTPDSSYNNNWSVSPNVNPFTGQQGRREPTANDRAPQPIFGGQKSCPVGVFVC
jgi:hypothetical protein